jgi:hypothetical protein
MVFRGEIDGNRATGRVPDNVEAVPYDFGDLWLPLTTIDAVETLVNPFFRRRLWKNSENGMRQGHRE